MPTTRSRAARLARLAPLALLGPLLGGLSAPARAAGFAEPVVELMPVGELLGDGLSVMSLHILLLNADGSPMRGLEGAVKATQGEVGALAEQSPGLYRFSYTPPAVEAELQVELRVKGKLPDKQKIDRIWSLPVTPPIDQQVSVSIDPASLVIGRDAQANLSVRLQGGAQASREGASLAFSSNSGEVKNLIPMGDGSYAALYVPPAKGAPHAALIGVVDRRSPGRTYGHLAVPMTARLSIDTKSGPGCKVMLIAGGREFGPAAADAKGRAKVEVVVPPGLDSLVQRSLDCAAAGETTLPLPPVESPRVQLLPVHGGLPGDARISVPVRAFVVTRSGEPDPGAVLRLSASAGALSPPQHEGGGVYLSTYTPAAVGAVSPLRIEASLAGEEKRVAVVNSQLVPLKATALQVSTEPARLPKEATSFTLTARVLGPDGQGMPGRALDFKTAGARLSGEVKDLGDGSYTATFQTTGRGPAEVTTSVRAPAAGNPVRDVVILPTRARLPADGLSSSMLTVLTLDEFGYPVADAPLKLRLVQGDGQLPTSGKTDQSGLTQLSYTAGRATTVVHIEVEAGGRRRGISLLQAAPELAPEVQLEGAALAPTPEARAAIEAWAPIVTRTWIERD